MDIIQLIQAVGVPVTLLLLVLIWLWRAGQYLAVQVVKPWTERHMAFIDRIETNTLQQAVILAAVVRTQEQHAAALNELVKTLEAIRVKVSGDKQ